MTANEQSESNPDCSLYSFDAVLIPGDYITRLYSYILDQALNVFEAAVKIVPYFVLGAGIYAFLSFKTI